MTAHKESLRLRVSRACADGIERGPRHPGLTAAACATALFTLIVIIGASTGDTQGAAIFGVAFIIYWLPALIAWGRRVRNQAQVTIVNLFLGWTVIGWIAALVMAAG